MRFIGIKEQEPEIGQHVLFVPVGNTKAYAECGYPPSYCLWSGFYKGNGIVEYDDEYNAKEVIGVWLPMPEGWQEAAKQC